MPESNKQKTWVPAVLPPLVYRYLEREFVEQFFDTGEIMLSSFSRFSSHADEQRKDEYEGRNVIFIEGDECTAVYDVGFEKGVYVMSTTAIEQGSTFLESTKYNAAIKIFDTVNFAMHIANALPDFYAGVEGYCIYQKYIKRLNNNLTFGDLKASNSSHEKRMAVLQESNTNPGYFRKDPKYSEQLEYRFVWGVEGNTEETIVVKAPDARQFCKPLYL